MPPKASAIRQNDQHKLANGDTEKYYTRDVFHLWDVCRFDPLRRHDQSYVFITLNGFKDDLTQATSKQQEPFAIHFEQIRQVVMMALAHVKHRMSYLNYYIECRKGDWCWSTADVGGTWNCNYLFKNDIEGEIQELSRRSVVPRTVIVVSDNNNDVVKAVESGPFPAKLFIRYPAANDPRSLRFTGPYWLLNTPQITFTRSRDFDWKAIGEDCDSLKSASPNAVTFHKDAQKQISTGTPTMAQGSAEDHSSKKRLAIEAATQGAVAGGSPAIKEAAKEAPAKEGVAKSGLAAEGAVTEDSADENLVEDEKPETNRLGKRKREEETDGYLAFVERTMAAYKKL